MAATPRPLLAASAALATVALAASARLGTPAPRGTDAPSGEFSSERAVEIIRDLAGDASPRPVGSEANLATVRKIAARLSEMGLETELHETFACGPYGTCAFVLNVVARLGPEGPKAVLLSAHHDSVGAGPGISDDLSGVAIVLEVARAIAAGPALARPFVALLTDAEEPGLVGASAFVEGHPWAKQVGAVVNVEARGTSGPSILFDTSRDPPWIGDVARRLPRPVASSLAAAVYDLLPNDTDLTVMEAHGLPGVNLAFAGDVVRYHTPLDDLRHLDPGSLQQQGENALALVRAIAGEDLEHAEHEPTAFLDVLGLTVLSYGHPLSLAIVAALAVALAAAALLRRQARPLDALVAGLGASIAAPIAAALPVLLAWAALRGSSLPRAFVAYPEPLVLAAWAAGAGAALLAAAVMGRRAGAAGLFAGAASLHAALGLVLATALPGASHVVVLPALAAGVAGLAWARRPQQRTWSLLPGVVASLVLFPVALLLPPMLGVAASILVAPVVSLAALFAAPLAASLAGRARWASPVALLALVFVLAGVQAALPHATEDRPERVTIAFHEEDGTARWLVQAEHDDLPPGLRAAAPFDRRREAPFPWAPLRPSFSAPARPLGLPPPRIVARVAEQTEQGMRRVRARLVSARGAPVLFLLLPPEVPAIFLSMEGAVAPEPAAKALRFWGGHRLHACVTAPDGGVEIDVVLLSTGPVPAILVDQTFGLPGEGARLAAARPATAVPSQDGDVTMVTARGEL